MQGRIETKPIPDKITPMQMALNGHPQWQKAANSEELTRNEARAAIDRLYQFTIGIQNHLKLVPRFENNIAEFDTLLDSQAALGKSDKITYSALMVQQKAVETNLGKMSVVANFATAKAVLAGLKEIDIDIGQSAPLDLTDKQVEKQYAEMGMWLKKENLSSTANLDKFMKLIDIDEETLGISAASAGDDVDPRKFYISRVEQNNGLVKTVSSNSRFNLRSSSLEFLPGGHGLHQSGKLNKFQIAATIAYAKKHGWKSVVIDGPPGNRKNLDDLYIALKRAGFEVTGDRASKNPYSPSKKVIAKSEVPAELAMKGTESADQQQESNVIPFVKPAQVEEEMDPTRQQAAQPEDHDLDTSPFESEGQELAAAPEKSEQQEITEELENVADDSFFGDKEELEEDYSQTLNP